MHCCACSDQLVACGLQNVTRGKKEVTHCICLQLHDTKNLMQCLTVGALFMTHETLISDLQLGCHTTFLHVGASWKLARSYSQTAAYCHNAMGFLECYRAQC